MVESRLVGSSPIASKLLHLTTLKAGNQVVLEEASVDEFLATLMANRKVESSYDGSNQANSNTDL